MTNANHTMPRTLADFAETLISDPHKREPIYFPTTPPFTRPPMSWRSVVHATLGTLLIVGVVAAMVMAAQWRWGL